MNTNPNKKNLIKITSGKVILHYPHLLKPNTQSKFGNSQAKYSTNIIISKNDVDTLNKIDIAIKDSIIASGFSDNANIKSPLKDGDADYPYNRLYENSMYMYVSTLFKPRIVDHNLKDIMFRMDEFMSGTYAKVSMYFEGYKSYETDKCGISAKLLNVQIFPQNKLLEFQSSPEDDFVVEAVDEE